MWGGGDDPHVLEWSQRGGQLRCYVEQRNYLFLWFERGGALWRGVLGAAFGVTLSCGFPRVLSHGFWRDPLVRLLA